MEQHVETHTHGVLHLSGISNCTSRTLRCRWENSKRMGLGVEYIEKISTHYYIPKNGRGFIT